VSQNEPEEEYLTVAEVAGNLKLNQQTVRNWIDRGELPALRVGRRVRIKRSDYERYLRDGYNGGTPPERVPASPSGEDFWGGESVGLAEPQT
jgi:putative molybdopterin biosynthesis protein